MAVDFIQSQRFQYNDLSERIGALEELYTRKCVRLGRRKAPSVLTHVRVIASTVSSVNPARAQALVSADGGATRLC